MPAEQKVEKKADKTDKEEKKNDTKEVTTNGDAKPAAKSAEEAKNSKETHGGDRDRTIKEYEKMKKDLKDLIGKKRTLDRNLNNLEEQIYKVEGSYLEDTSTGNVVRGYDNYMKTNPNKRRATVTEQDRVFSLSSAVFLKVKMKDEEANP